MNREIRRRSRRQRKRERGDRAKQPFWRRLWRRLLKAVPVFLIATVLTFLLSQVGALQKLETIALDTQMRLRASPNDSDVAIVRITDEDYRDKFQGKSPLDPKALQEIINAIALGKPKMIGIDIDTSASVFRDVELPTSSTPIVWGRDAVFSRKEEKFYLLNVLGGRSPSPPSGIMLLKEDADGAVRRYQRVYQTKQGTFPSFPWAVVKHLPDIKADQLPETDEEMLISFVGSPKDPFRVSLPASQVLSVAVEAGWQNDSPLRNKIVLLGGDYAAQDEHDTPLGWMLGVEVLAYVIETELQGGGMRPANRIAIAVLQIVDGLVLLVLFQIYGLKRAMLVGIIGIPVLALVCSLIAFWSFAQWAYFIPILIAVFLQQVYDRLKDIRKELAVEAFQTAKGIQQDGKETSAHH